MRGPQESLPPSLSKTLIVAHALCLPPMIPESPPSSAIRAPISERAFACCSALIAPLWKAAVFSAKEMPLALDRVRNDERGPALELFGGIESAEDSLDIVPVDRGHAPAEASPFLFDRENRA